MIPAFDGKRVLVIGGTSGIGAAIADGFTGQEAEVIVTGAEGTRPGAVTLDVRDRAAVEDLVGGMGRLDHLIYCAGIIRRGDEHDPAVFADVLAINLTGAMIACTAARPLLAESGGTILLTASMLSWFGGGLVPGYSASKGGIAQLTKSLAIAYAPEGIRVNALAPGWIATALTDPLRDNPEREAAILSRTPLGRWGRPEDLTGPALFLASPHAGFITGAVVPVDGGYLAA
ncbi:MAG: SDR family oxidoreductase [Rubellimicrobium sp.]|nr:SDR family oxidoreductase [Rubellimicrobium sp.]